MRPGTHVSNIARHGAPGYSSLQESGKSQAGNNRGIPPFAKSREGWAPGCLHVDALTRMWQTSPRKYYDSKHSNLPAGA